MHGCLKLLVRGGLIVDAVTIAVLLVAGFGGLTILRMMAALREAMMVHHEHERERAERRRQRQAAMMAVATGV